MHELIRISDKLKAMRRAQHRFLILWAVEESVIDPGLDRMAADLNAGRSCAGGWDPPGPLDGIGPMADE